MLFKTLSASVFGIDAYPVEVEVDITAGKPLFLTVGLPDAAVRESSERIRSAIKNCGLQFPWQTITVNLAPADVKKEGSGFDLPIALGILGTTGALLKTELKDILFLGELSLDGSLRPIKPGGQLRSFAVDMRHLSVCGSTASHQPRLGRELARVPEAAPHRAARAAHPRPRPAVRPPRDSEPPVQSSSHAPSRQRPVVPSAPFRQ